MASNSTRQATRSRGSEEDTTFLGGYSSSYMSTRNICRPLDLQRDDQQWRVRCLGNANPPFYGRKCNTQEHMKNDQNAKRADFKFISPTFITLSGPLCISQSALSGVQGLEHLRCVGCDIYIKPNYNVASGLQHITSGLFLCISGFTPKPVNTHKNLYPQNSNFIRSSL